MDIREIPGIVFREFAENIREKDGITIGALKGVDYAFLGLQTDPLGIVSLGVWASKKDIGKGHRCIFRIEAGIRDTGEWAAGKGSRMEESVWFRGPHWGHQLNRATLALADILQRASELALSDSVERGTFWESDRHPERYQREPPP